MDIVYVAAEIDAEPRTLFGSEYAERSPVISPDGRLLAFTSDESGRDEIYVMALVDPASARRVSREGGTEPRWAHSGDRILFRSGTLLAEAEITTTGRLSVSEPRTLFLTHNPYESNIGHTTYEVDIDDSRFLMIRQSYLGEAVVVFNLSEELDDRAGGG